eukprot:Phypoly_transcript_13001.p1 GENE.Phypoly_transcript_13001~~Phypoly_transcript_13001.p1  ORF type:complete len:260 (+),score=51.20 Phypoly_transcript_13001:164-943(+)
MAGTTRRVQDLVAIITGSGAGIGRATAEFFAEEGAKVVVVDVDVQGGEECVAEIKKKGGEAVFLRVDVSNEEECRKLAEDVVAKYGRIDCLVNNAAVFVLKSHLNATKEDWTRSFSVNVFGTALISKYVSEKMKEQRSGSIVNLGSISAHVGQPDLACYSATKAAIVGLTKNMAMDLAPFNIRVNSLSPGSVFTVASERHAKSMGIPIDQFKKEQGAMNFQKRMADPREIAAPILFLSSKEASFITGTDLLVDGGYTAM